MTTPTSTTGFGGLLPDQNGPLIVQPVTDASVATQVTNVVTNGSHEFHVPVVEDAAFAEVTVVPAKLAGLTIISRERPRTAA